MSSIHFKDVILYFITANAFFFMLLHSDKETVVVPFGMLLLMLLFIYLVRIQSHCRMDGIEDA